MGYLCVVARQLLHVGSPAVLPATASSDITGDVRCLYLSRLGALKHGKSNIRATVFSFTACMRQQPSYSSQRQPALQGNSDCCESTEALVRGLCAAIDRLHPCMAAVMGRTPVPPVSTLIFVGSLHSLICALWRLHQYSACMRDDGRKQDVGHKHPYYSTTGCRL